MAKGKTRDCPPHAEEHMSQPMDVGSLSNLRVLSAVILAGAMVLASACSSDVRNPVAPGAGTGVVNAEHESSSTAASPAASSALEGDDLCHRTSGTTAFVLITVPTSVVDAHIAHGDAPPGSPVPGQPDMFLSRNCTPVSTGPITIAFDGLKGSAFKGYSQDGFTVSPTSGRWMALTTYGNPLPSIIFTRSAAQPTITAAVTITASGSEFRFQSVDLYSSITTIPYVFTGRLKSNQVFSVSAEEGNTFGSFVTVPNPNATDTIDTLVITLSNPETPCCPNPVGLDNIVVVYQP